MRSWIMATLLLTLLAGACGEREPESPPTVPPPAELPPVVRGAGEPDRVLYNQILISFAGAKGNRNSTRSREQARRLAHTLVARLKAGEDYLRLMNDYSDDCSAASGKANGPYVACNIGVEHRLRPDNLPEIPRGDLERDVGDAVFSMGINEARLVEYDERTCPWGWHILHRVR